MRLLSCCLLVLVGCSSASFETVAPLDSDPGDGGADSSTEGGIDASDSGATDTASDADAVSVDGDGAPSCDVTKTPAEASCVLRDDLGIFVSTDLGSDGNPGTRAAPVKTLAKALALAKDAKKRVYACAEQFNEVVTALDGVAAYGGLDCKTGWTTVIGQTKVVSTASPTLRVRDASVGVTFVSFDFHAPKGTGVSGSSVAAVVANSKASFELCAFSADTATAGVDGDAGPFGNLGDSGKLGQDARTIAACPDQPLGGKGGIDFSNGGSGANACDAASSFGPKGGNASVAKDATCGLGTQFDGGSGVCGLLVIGKGFLTGLDKGCPATDGANGGPGKSLGAVTADGLAAALPGGDGIIGGAGGGGGGGGAGLLGTSTAAGGGGGGAGGQGGGGGKGGKPGGSSVAFLSFNADVTLTKCDLHAGDAGNGGNGGTGSSGGDGGKGAEGGKPKTNPNERGCRGGDGARGGTGGGGGGGGGGSSIGILVVGSKPKRTGGTVTLGTAGSGGNGGMGVTRAAKGDEGTAIEQLNL